MHFSQNSDEMNGKLKYIECIFGHVIHIVSVHIPKSDSFTSVYSCHLRLIPKMLVSTHTCCSFRLRLQSNYISFWNLMIMENGNSERNSRARKIPKKKDAETHIHWKSNRMEKSKRWKWKEWNRKNIDVIVFNINSIITVWHVFGFFFI